MSDPNDYTVGWICALPTELTAARLFLDEEHDRPSRLVTHDSNSYILGAIKTSTGSHNVVIATLPNGEYGLCNAAGVATDMLNSFPNVRIGFMVGIGGGAPTAKHDIRLGDVVVSSPGNSRGGVYQYDYGKTIQGCSFQQTGSLNQPPLSVLSSISVLRSTYEIHGHQIENNIQAVLEKAPRLKKKYARPNPKSDRLYISSKVHTDDGDECACLESRGTESSDIVKRLNRDPEFDLNPAIHYGSVASANQLMKDALTRDKLAKEQGILCFETEAAGIMNRLPCLVVRGICDYSDSHKNKDWQGYAAMAAAAYTKDLLRQIVPTTVEEEKKMSELLGSVYTQVRLLEGNLQQKHILDWFLPSDPSIDQYRAFKARHRGTCQWLLDHKTFQLWKTRPNAFLWLHGISGCGKTILASAVINELQAENELLLFFYFSVNDQRKQTLSQLLRTLLNQAQLKSEAARDVVQNLYASCGSGSSQPTPDQLVESLNTVIGQSSRVNVVVDALDECTQIPELVTWMTELHDLDDPNLRLFVTSRKEGHLEPVISSWPRTDATLAVQDEEIGADIRNYVHSRIQHKEFAHWNGRTEIQEEVQETILEKSNGMFRLAVCQLDALRTALDPASLGKTLHELPKELHKMYVQMLSKIEPKVHHKVVTMLQILIWSATPLGPDEMIDALAVTLDTTPGFHEDNRVFSLPMLIKHCSSLVIVVDLPEQLGVTRSEIRLAHSSVKEFLLSPDLPPPYREDLSENQANGTLAKIYITYLLHIFEQFPTFYHSDGIEDFPLLEFALRYWVGHARLSEREDQDLVKLILELFRSETALGVCIAMNDKSPSLLWCSPDDVDGFVDPLYAAISFELVSVTEYLLAQGARLDGQDDRPMGSALNLAARKGRDDLVEMLLSAGADPNAFDEHLGSAVLVASRKGHTNTVRTLLDYGADANLPGRRYHTALQAAVSNDDDDYWFCDEKSSDCRLEIVQQLLNHGADVNAQGGRYHTALQAAASQQDGEEVAALLLRWQADVNKQGGRCGNALYAAIMSGQHRLARILLEAGAIISNPKSEQASLALYQAASLGYADLVEQLVEANVDPNQHLNTFHPFGYKLRGFALHEASRNGHESVIKLFLRGGADINAAINGFTALHSAAQFNRGNIVELLLDEGADIDAYARTCGTPLNVALKYGHLSVLITLLDRGGSTIPGPGYGGGLLRVAVQEGHKDIAKMLIGRNIGVDLNTKSGRDAFYVARTWNHDEIMETTFAANELNSSEQAVQARGSKRKAIEGPEDQALDLRTPSPKRLKRISKLPDAG